jgi:hypothetical protein
VKSTEASEGHVLLSELSLGLLVSFRLRSNLAVHVSVSSQH